MLNTDQAEIRAFIDYLKFEKRYSINTIISYHNDLSDFYRYSTQSFEVQSVQDISSVMIRSWLASLKSNGMASRSVNRKISSLKSFFKYHLKTGKITAIPTLNVTVPKVNKRLPSFIRESEARQLLELLESTTEDWKSLNAKMLITLFYVTGMRLSELINLKESQLDFARTQIRVLGKGNKERIIPVSKKLIAIIQDYLSQKRKNFQNANDFLLLTAKGKRLYPKYAWLLVNKYLGQTCTLEKKSPHVLRHSFATHLLNNGADLNAVKDLLGHASLAATQVYTHNTIGKLKDVHKKAHPKA